MSKWRDTIKAVSAVVHDTFSEKVIVRGRLSDSQTTCRIHDKKLVQNGDPSNSGFAVMNEFVTKAVFLDRFDISKNDLLILEDRVYRVDNKLPYDGRRTTVEVILLTADLTRKALLNPDLPFGGLTWVP